MNNDNIQIQNIHLGLPQSLESIDVPVQVGPSSFPNNIDQLKTIDYSAVPNDSILEAKLSRYYQLLSIIAGNNATEKDISELQRLMIDVRNYVVTEEDFNLMADAVRTTQIYLKNAADANVNNYRAISEAVNALSESLNDWTLNLNQAIERIGSIPTVTGVENYSFGPNQPTKAPIGTEPGSNYYWVDTANGDYVLKQSVVGEDLSVNNFTEVSLNEANKQTMTKFTAAADVFKRKTVICTKDDFQCAETTYGVDSTNNTNLLEYTSQNDLVLEELSIGNNSGQVSNVDDLIDGKFEYGLTPVSLVDNININSSYPEDADYNSQGGE